MRASSFVFEVLFLDIKFKKELEQRIVLIQDYTCMLTYILYSLSNLIFSYCTSCFYFKKSIRKMIKNIDEYHYLQNGELLHFISSLNSLSK